MKDDFSASASAVATSAVQEGNSPFAQISKIEEQEIDRVNIEVEAMKKEKEEVEKALQEKEAQTDLELREEAKKELVEYRESDLKPLVQNAEVKADKETEKLEKTYAEKEKNKVSELVDTFTNYSSQVA